MSEFENDAMLEMTWTLRIWHDIFHVKHLNKSTE